MSQEAAHMLLQRAVGAGALVGAAADPANARVWARRREARAGRRRLADCHDA